MDRDAKLNDLIRLKQAPPAPVERWQMVPTRRCPGPGTVGERKSKPFSLNQHGSSPLRQIPSNIQISKTPETGRLLMKTPSARVKSKTPSACATSRTPGAQQKSTTPGRNGPTPSSSCRFIPNRCVNRHWGVEFKGSLSRKLVKQCYVSTIG